MRSFAIRRHQRGQTLIIAMIILGLLLILGFVFLGIVDRNIRGTATAQTRSQANDLAEAGIRQAHYQLVNSPLGADWRGTPTTLSGVAGNANVTLDPDAYYLRQGSYLPLTGPPSNQEDLGGPDGDGPFIRMNFNGGRALVRVRLAPSDVNYFNASPTGPLRNPGEVHDYLQIEAIGRIGTVNTSDPTTLATGSGIQFQGFTTTPQLQAALAQMQQFDSRFANSRHLLAFDTTGVIDFARFITNKFNVSRAADIGIPNPSITGLAGVGVTYSPNGTGNDLDVGTMLVDQLGTLGNIQSGATPAVPISGGSIMCNAPLTIHGNVVDYLDLTLGDKIICNNSITGDDNASLQLNQSLYNPTTNTWATNQVNLTPVQFSSRSSSYTTASGSLVDGVGGTDQSGYSRGAGTLVPPSMLQQDPNTHESRYQELTRDLGGINSNGTKSSEYGHGEGVYVSNPTDVQAPIDEAGRVNSLGTESQLSDWQNPNNTDKTSGWQGPFYIPVGGFVQLRTDGFVITLDQNQTWKYPNGTDSGQSALRFRVGTFNGQTYIVDGLETPGTINNDPSQGQTAPDFSQGQPFNGVLYFDGNVRVKGQIPTDVQLTIVSGATIYIEGSITKGLYGNDVTDAYPNTATVDGVPLKTAYKTLLSGRMSKSALMLMAKDNVAVNPTQFLGPPPGQAVSSVNDTQNDTGYDPIRISATGTANGSLALDADVLLDPNTAYTGGYNPLSPSTWQPYATNYTDSLTGAPLDFSVLLSHTMDDGTGSAAFISMLVNYGSYASADQHEANYAFPGSPSSAEGAGQGPDGLLGYFSGFDNTASDYLYNSTQPGYWGSLSAPPDYSQDMYGLGRDSWQRYDQFESRAFHLIYPGASTVYNNTNGQITSTDSTTTDPYIQYALFAAGTNELQIHPNSINGVSTNDYLLARAALAPHNVRIEASIFAEEGCFYVIPGPWFNPNPNDTRDNYNKQLIANGGTLTPAQASLQRLESYGTGPECPFYGEPIDVKVEVVGSVSENMPPPESAQVASIQKWGWIPVQLGALTNSAGVQLGIPTTHIPAGTNPTTTPVVPNVIVEYDPMLATGRIDGFSGTNDPSGWVRTDAYQRPLAPMPRLPVSPVPTYFGEIQ